MRFLKKRDAEAQRTANTGRLVGLAPTMSPEELGRRSRAAHGNRPPTANTRTQPRLSSAGGHLEIVLDLEGGEVACPRRRQGRSRAVAEAQHESAKASPVPRGSPRSGSQPVVLH